MKRSNLRLRIDIAKAVYSPPSGSSDSDFSQLRKAEAKRQRRHLRNLLHATTVTRAKQPSRIVTAPSLILPPR